MRSSVQILAIIFLALVLMGCENNNTEGYINVGMSPNYPPWEYKEGDALMGFDVEVASYIGTKLKKEIRIKEMPFEDLLEAIKSKEIDMAISAIPISDRWSKFSDFSYNYYSTRLVILSKAHNSYKSFESLLGTKVGVLSGTHIYKMLVEYNKSHENSKMNLVTFKRGDDIIKPLIEGLISAIVVESVHGRYIMKNQPDNDIVLEMARDYNEVVRYAIALPKESNITGAVNNILRQMGESGLLYSLQSKFLE